MKLAYREYALSHSLHLMLKSYVLLPSPEKLMLTAEVLLETLHPYHPMQGPTKLPHPPQLREAAASYI